jgi:hypothetical protein
MLLGLLEERRRAEDAGAVDEHVHADPRALLEQPPGRLLADAASAAGDDGHFVFE